MMNQRHPWIYAKRLVMEVLTEWMDAGDRTILMASHQISDMEKLFDFPIVLKDGKVVANDEKERLASHFHR
ncbi:hypothetical protein P5G51_012380 [Virgibacillus sp. 179-BFC.A HS]|uniref:ABC transporter ATP-binding protein n=1 Tax=Tigheibacillus jepli TaxID=3035914 RepID=A0ABU5CIF1_9BACI|nr:hypothetical protein [Virgibacillus sp. 179-BFC.A HS]MDY0406081.1 hypothetical protein [Virgibacillus sp. 179-BFC.A HS]